MKKWPSDSQKFASGKINLSSDIYQVMIIYQSLLFHRYTRAGIVFRVYDIILI